VFNNASNNGVNPNDVLDIIASNVQQMDTLTAVDFLSNLKEIKLPNNQTLGGIINEDKWNAIESKLEQRDQKEAASMNRTSINDATTLNNLTKTLEGDDNELPEFSGQEGERIVQNIRTLLYNGDNSSAISELKAAESTGSISRSEAVSLVKEIKMAQFLTPAFMSKQFNIVHRGSSQINPANTEVSGQLSTIFNEEFIKQASEFIQNNPDATIEQIKANILNGEQTGIAALERTAERVKVLDTQFTNERNGRQKLEDEAKDAAKTDLTDNDPWLSRAFGDHKKVASQTAEQVGQFYSKVAAIGYDNLSKQEINSFPKVKKWNTDANKKIIKNATDIIINGNGRTVMVGPDTRVTMPATNAQKAEALDTYFNARKQTGFSARELLNGETVEGIKISTEAKAGQLKLNPSDISAFTTRVFDTTAELEWVTNNPERLKQLTTTLGVLNIPNFIDRQRQFLKLEGR
jgi:hypothetical protein